MGKRYVFLLVGAVAILIGGCAPAQSVARPVQPEDASPEPAEAYWPTEGWRTSTPEEQGMDSEMLAQMLNTIREQGHEIDSVTVIRNGTIVADATVHPFQPDSRHVIHSCTKSIVSALIGIAIDEGHIEGVDQPVVAFFPERSIANLDADKKAMTLEHVLMMAGGWECRDSYLYRWSGIAEMRRSGDWVGFMLDLPMVEKPGTRFEYCNGGSFLLSAIVQETTGMSSRAFAEKRLFGPLGISDVVWPSNPQGISIGWGEMRMRPHDMAKIGYLYLKDGEWAGEQIVPADWVAAATRKHIDATLQDGYGYQWWVTDGGIYMALGYSGQYIVVVPEKDIVVVFTSQLAERDFYTPQRLLEGFIIPAAKSSAPLPANPDGVAALQAAVRDLATP
jgi:CubicO group peptidase (beta-lactamase class C family)